jgi:hypothetical protein
VQHRAASCRHLLGVIDVSLDLVTCWRSLSGAGAPTGHYLAIPSEETWLHPLVRNVDDRCLLSKNWQHVVDEALASGRLSGVVQDQPGARVPVSQSNDSPEVPAFAALW